MMCKFLTTALVAWSSVMIAVGAEADPLPEVLGAGIGRFEIGDLLVADDFENLDNWVVQLEQVDGFESARVEAKEGKLDCDVPGRGCTVWFKQKLKTRTTISYEVLCPSPEKKDRALAPSDLNQFWMAMDPEGGEEALFNAKRYTGGFGSYDKMHCYYASTGGGRNTTTRFRRYPRQVDGRPVDHLALTHRDGQPEFMIPPDRWMRVQLVAYDGVIQYIVDGQLVYEVTDGARVQVESRDAEGRKFMKEAVYGPKAFPAYREGYFGFRMVKTHHVYSKFRVHELKPARKRVEVDSIDGLRKAATESRQEVVMKPGSYVLENLIDGRMGVEFSGSDNHFDLTGVTVITPLEVFQSREVRRSRSRSLGTAEITGDRVVLKGAKFESQYRKSIEGPIDFGTYNQNPDNHPSRSVTEMRLRGDDLKLIDCRFTVRGSYPYGYGNIYGIGGGAVVPLRKHSGVLVTGDRVLIEGCHVKMEAFGHAIFVQGGDEVTVRDCEVEGSIRPSNGIHQETEGSLAKRFDFKIQWPENVAGLPVPRDHMINLVEDGIRAYGGTGRMIVERCKVTKCRGGIKLYMARSATVRDCEVRDCIIQAYSIPRRGEIIQSRGNAAYGPLLYVHMDSHSAQKIDLEVLPAPHSLGDHPLAAIKGQGHQIRLRSKESVPSGQRRPIIVGYPLRFDYLTRDYPAVPAGFEENFRRFAPKGYRAKEITLVNDTEHPVVMGEQSENNRIESVGEVTDPGRSNRVSRKTAVE